MQVVLVFESVFGNTEELADAVASGLRERGAEVAVVRVGDAGDHDQGGLDLLVLGGPTHAFSTSRPSTRADAAARPHSSAVPRDGVREWLEAARHSTGPAGRPPVAVFDTRARIARHWPGSAARVMERSLRRMGFNVPERVSFYVVDVAGPVVDGESARAREWGRHLADLHG